MNGIMSDVDHAEQCETCEKSGLLRRNKAFIFSSSGPKSWQLKEAQCKKYIYVSFGCSWWKKGAYIGVFSLPRRVSLSASTETSDSMKLASFLAENCECTVVYSPAKKTPGAHHRGGTQHYTLFSKQEQRREKTSTNEGGTKTPRPPGLAPLLPQYLLKLSWFGSGPAGPSFTLFRFRFPLLHTQKQHEEWEVSCSSRLTSMYILNMPEHTRGGRGGVTLLGSVWPVGEVKQMGMFPIRNRDVVWHWRSLLPFPTESKLLLSCCYGVCLVILTQGGLWHSYQLHLKKVSRVLHKPQMLFSYL